MPVLYYYIARLLFKPNHISVNKQKRQNNFNLKKIIIIQFIPISNFLVFLKYLPFVLIFHKTFVLIVICTKLRKLANHESWFMNEKPAAVRRATGFINKYNVYLSVIWLLLIIIHYKYYNIVMIRRTFIFCNIIVIYNGCPLVMHFMVVTCLWLPTLYNSLDLYLIDIIVC